MVKEVLSAYGEHGIYKVNENGDVESWISGNNGVIIKGIIVDS